jgi:glutamyl-tRNA reductase
MYTQANIAVLGISHSTAPVEIREQVAFDKNDQEVAIAEIKHLYKVDGCLIISTCNRTEVYLSGENGSKEIPKIKKWLNTFKKCSYFTDEKISYVIEGIDAVHHFFKVISGIDSLIVGETQITNQVKECFNTAFEIKTTDTWLNKLYNYGLQAEKKVRNDTFLNDGAVSVSFAGVELARKIFSDLSKKNVLLIGAGETGELAARHFADKHVKSIHIVNRTLKKAQDLAEILKGHAYPIEVLNNVLLEVDIVISATSSKEFIVTQNMMHEISKKRHYAPLFMIDLSIPRDIDPAINEIDGIYLYNIDDLHEIVEMNLEKRKQEIPKSLKIIDHFVLEFKEWISTHSVSFMISRLKDHFENIRKKEMIRLKNRLPQTKNGEIDYLTQSIVNKIVHQHIRSLKKSINDPERYQKHVEFLYELYQLDEKE